MKLKLWLAAAVVGITALTGPVALAVTPDEMLKDPALESRARDLGQELRCVVCQNQSIDDSNAPLAHDLRVLLRERISAGDTNQQAVDYLVARYGSYVLLKPPFQVSTFLLWTGPFIALALALWGFYGFVRPRAAPATAAATSQAGLTEDEQKRLDELLKEGKAQ